VSKLIFGAAIAAVSTATPALAQHVQLYPAASLDQLEAIRSGRLDAGFVNFMPKADPELDQLAVGTLHARRSTRIRMSASREL
jgi:hypothetical protein